jgi:ferredoxin
VTVSIDSSRCQGHGRCALSSPEVFDVDDDGYGVVLVSEPGPDQLADVQLAIDNCPERAISLT